MRRNFSSPPLVRCLGDLDDAEAGDIPGKTSRPAAPVPAGMDVAERLSLWVGVFDAGTLHAVLQGTPAQTAAAPSRSPGRGAVPAAEQLRQVRALLTRGITDGPQGLAEPGRGRQGLEAPATPVPGPEADFAPFRQHYLDQQRHMDLLIAPLRDSVRQSAAALSPELRQLAALDAVWERMLAVREQKLMAGVPQRLKRRFERLLKAHTAGSQRPEPSNPSPSPAAPAPQTRSSDAPAPSHGERGAHAMAWLDRFGHEVQQVLLAELDARLAPITGLVEACDHALHELGEPQGPRGTAPLPAPHTAARTTACTATSTAPAPPSQAAFGDDSADDRRRSSRPGAA